MMAKGFYDARQSDEPGLKQRKKDGRWRYDFFDAAGRRHRHIVDTKGEGKAKLLEALLQRSRDEVTVPSTTLSAALKRWQEDNEKKLAVTTRRNDRGYAAEWTDILGAKTRLTSINRYQISALVREVRDTPKADGTPRSPRRIRASIERLRTFFGWCVVEGLLERNPVSYYLRFRDLDAALPRTRVMTRDEENRLLAALSIPEEGTKGRSKETVKLLFEMLMATGMRLDEARALTWPEVNLDECYVTLPPTRHKTGKKTHRERMVGLNSKAVAILQSLPQRSGYCFSRQRGSKYNTSKWKTGDKPIAFSTVYSHWANALKATGIVDLETRDLRRTFCTRACEAGMPESDVVKMMGHTNSLMVRRVYDQSRRNPVHLAELARRCENLQRGLEVGVGSPAQMAFFCHNGGLEETGRTSDSSLFKGYVPVVAETKYADDAGSG